MVAQPAIAQQPVVTQQPATIMTPSGPIGTTGAIGKTTSTKVTGGGKNLKPKLKLLKSNKIFI